ncbi:MAG: DUF366 family protein [candidate division Zixibacteria bacterium]|nr:DUF366 family protein [candidate division Zixibacteria bacterium]
MKLIKAHFDAAERPYAELYGHYAYKNFGISGDAIVAFIGPCEVRGEDLVDLADRQAGAEIVAARMLHFIVEHFGLALGEVIWRQRVLAAIVFEEVLRRAPAAALRREGDDVYVGDGKLTVSVATVSPTSALVHLGVNVDGSGAPVPVCDLRTLGVDAAEFALAVIERYAAEVESFVNALGKVRGVC